jgi:MarR family transcriptional regulator for hemolysin
MDIYKVKINRSNLLLRLGYLTRRWRQILDTEFQSSGLTDATWRPLLHLHILGDDIRQKDLAASLGIEGPSLVRLIDSLITKGLIERSEDVRDRRAKLLRLTPAGLKLVESIRKTVTGLEDGIFSSFDDDELARFADFVQRLESSVIDARERYKP